MSSEFRARSGGANALERFSCLSTASRVSIFSMWVGNGGANALTDTIRIKPACASSVQHSTMHRYWSSYSLPTEVCGISGDAISSTFNCFSCPSAWWTVKRREASLLRDLFGGASLLRDIELASVKHCWPTQASDHGPGSPWQRHPISRTRVWTIVPNKSSSSRHRPAAALLWGASRPHQLAPHSRVESLVWQRHRPAASQRNRAWEVAVDNLQELRSAPAASRRMSPATFLSRNSTRAAADLRAGPLLAGSRRMPSADPTSPIPGGGVGVVGDGGCASLQCRGGMRIPPMSRGDAHSASHLRDRV